MLTAADLPGRTTFGLEFCDQPVLAGDVVRYAGEPVAVVAAETAEQARAAAAAVRVEYEPLPAVTDMEAALEPDATQVHEFGNVLRHVHIERGDLHPDAEVWVEGYYVTAMQDQAALGPEGGLAVPDGDGGVDIYAVSQWLHVDRQQIAPCLGLPEEKVRLTLAGVGGAFGSREDLHMQLHAALLARATGRPVKIAYGREESFHGHVHRHPSRIWIRYGATRDGRLVAADVRLLLDGGAYASSSPAVLANASTFAAGPYEIPNVHVEGTVVYTNNPPCGAMRGFGAPQVCFAYESAMDALAAKLGIDPVDLRLRNVLHTGSVLPTGQVVTGSAPVREVIERCLAIPLPEGGRIAYPVERNVSRGESTASASPSATRTSRTARGSTTPPRRPSPSPSRRGDGADGRGRLRPGALHGARADRAHRARRRRRLVRAGDHGQRLGRLDLGVAPDDDDGRRRARRLPRVRAALDGAPSRRSRGRTRTTTGRPPASTSTGRAISTSRCLSPPSARSSRSTRSSAWRASSRSRPCRTPAAC